MLSAVDIKPGRMAVRDCCRCRLPSPSSQNMMMRDTSRVPGQRGGKWRTTRLGR